MPTNAQHREPIEAERYELRERPTYRFAANRREFAQALGAGLVIVGAARRARAQRGGGRRRGGGGRGEEGSAPVSERFHIAPDGVVTVLTSKVEVGQGARTQITQAAAEELRLPLEQIRVVMADTELCPDDGGTAGSRTTPSTVPAVRRAAAAARELLRQLAASRLSMPVEEIDVAGGTFTHAASGKKITLAELAQQGDALAAKLKEAPPTNAELRSVDQWQVLGRGAVKPTSREIVTGAHQYPSDVKRPGMLYGKVLRPPTLTGTLKSIDLGPAEAMEGVVAVRDNGFVGCAAPTSWQAAKAIDAIAATAEWDEKPHPSSDELYDHFKRTATQAGSDWPRPRSESWGDGPATIEGAPNRIDVAYHIPYIQHAPMEPRAAVAEWVDGKLTVWTGSQQPSRVQGELQEAFRLSREQVRVIIPDTGGGFGGKHSGEAAVEAARLAKAAGKSVSLRWTRAEEFTWAYSRPGGLIEVKAALGGNDKLLAWDFTNYNSGESALGTPYEIPHGRTQFLAADSPLRQGSYRALASTANTFARESAMDELAKLARVDPLEFRLQHLEEGRLRDVLVAAAEKFGWSKRREEKQQGRGVGLACGTEKGSFVAACAEVEVADGQLKVLSVCQAYECGAIQNPDNLRSQVAGCIIMGLGGALTEAMKFKDGKVLTDTFADYHVPRMSDVPELEIVLVDRKDLASLGAGETPIIAVAPAIANALADAAGIRCRSLPITARTT